MEEISLIKTEESNSHHHHHHDNDNNNDNDKQQIIINNNNNKIIYDNKCIYHSTQDIIYLCATCDKSAACVVCLAMDEYHRGHKVDLIDFENTTILFNQFKNQQYPNLKECLKTDKELEEESEKVFNSIQLKYNENVDKLRDEFKQLHSIIDQIELEAISKLTNHFQDNKDLNLKIKSKIIENSKNVNLIVERHKHVIDSYVVSCDTTTNQHIEIIKHNQLSKSLIDENKSKKNQLDNYKNTSIVFNASLTETIKESIKFYYYTITSKSINFKTLKKIYLGSEVFSIFENDCKITDDVTCLALGSDVRDLKALENTKNITSILLLDGFPLQLVNGSLPNTITSLYISSLEKPLLVGSIPQSVNYLYLLNGFNQQIEKGVIGSSVSKLFIGSVKHPFLNNTIPPTVKNIYRLPGVALTILDSKWNGPFSSSPGVWQHPIIKTIVEEKNS
ncbi:hypothetical protein DDB_G0271950 [Dictyostelium discoideum AX4]|uniref:B box-type domain-containing protein n=1 Tax=Dictyostelium discoideum TaxID=44689 RepID=Q55AD2_DICDI|nr:hypothetical protein DDB_G0271950 [Dictyostelium discoideum AX4]EAL71499.2 hypothetical protein DDB_G0271950 [Dictyostelium discoideum AX4]|eukprot:XP_645424.2 hypothetical protein DDB_G0271950 [Dictyostelium discoideum AX4]